MSQTWRAACTVPWYPWSSYIAFQFVGDAHLSHPPQFSRWTAAKSSHFFGIPFVVGWPLQIQVKMDQYPAWFQDVSGWMLHRNQGPNFWSIGNSPWKKGLVSGDWSEICVTLRQVWDLVETKWVDFKLDNCRGIRLSCSEGRVTNRMSRGDFSVAIWGGVCHWCPFQAPVTESNRGNPAQE